jgi:phosphoglycerate-specific signal transduction histidine kinase
MGESMRNYFEMSVYQFLKKLKRWAQEFAKKPLSPIQTLFILAISIFVAESVVIFVLFVLPGLSQVSEMFVDSFVLVVLVSPVLYFYIYRSFVLHIAERKRAEEELKAKQSEIEELNTNLEKRVQEELKKSRQKDFIMMHQSRLAAMGEMIANISHQWKQPLNALSILLYNIKDLFDDNESEEENIDYFIEKGIQQIMKMATTIDDFSNFFKPNREKEEFSINKALKNLWH